MTLAFLRSFLCAALAASASLASAQFLPPARLIVVTDGNHPPYLFRAADGQPQGLLKDKWELWSRSTGVPVDLQGVEWSAAQARMLDGEADVIDTFTFTETRARDYDFALAQSQIEARLFFPASLGGVHDVRALRGIAVGAKAGSACAEWLRAHDVPWLRTYPDLRQVIEATTGGEVRLFCSDAPVARHLLVEMGLGDQFNESAPIYTSSFDWAVRAGRGDLRDFVQAGFDRIPRAQLDTIEARWLGSPVRRPGKTYAWIVVLAVVSGLAVVAAVALRIRLLHRRARVASTIDPVTGLPNRRAVEDRLASAIAGANGQPVSLLLVSMDQLKAVNDAYGPRLADRLLEESAGRILDSVSIGDLVGSVGGGEFAVVLPASERFEDAVSVARRVLAALQPPCDFGGERIYCAASIGIASHPADGDNAQRIFQNASIALSRARAGRGDGYRVFKPEMKALAAGRMQLESALRGALDRGEFVVHYQPRFDTASGQAVGFEALLRWHHPERGLMPPAEFIPVLEETGAIAAVGEWVFRRACEQIRQWEDAGLQPLPIAVNLSASQFRHRSLDVTIARVIAETGVNAGLLELELTESSLMQDPEEAARVLRHLESYGVKLSVDDFGTGYSSLAYLKRFPLDSLKIDRTFVRDATTNSDDAAITKAIIQLAHTLGLRVVAEGVETAAQRDLLQSLECDEMQGFLFGRPMPAEEATALLLPALAALRSVGQRDSYR